MEQLFHLAKTAILYIYCCEQVSKQRPHQVVAVEHFYVACICIVSLLLSALDFEVLLENSLIISLMFPLHLT